MFSLSVSSKTVNARAALSQSIAGGIVHRFGYHAGFYSWRQWLQLRSCFDRDAGNSKPFESTQSSEDCYNLESVGVYLTQTVKVWHTQGALFFEYKGMEPNNVYPAGERPGIL